MILELRQRVMELEDDVETEGQQLKAVFMLRELALGTYVQRVRGAMSRWQRNVRDGARQQGSEWRCGPGVKRGMSSCWQWSCYCRRRCC